MNLRNMLLAAALVAVAACASQPATDAPLTVHQRYEAACVGSATAYSAITAVNNIHPLTASQQKSVLDAKAKIDKRCKLAPGGDYPYSASEAVMGELEGAAADIAKVKGEVQ